MWVSDWHVRVHNTWEQGLHLWEPECDVTSGVSWSIKHMHLQVTKLPGVTISQGDVNARYAAFICFGTNDRAIEHLLQFFIAAGVVPVVMGVQNVIKLETSALSIS